MSTGLRSLLKLAGKGEEKVAVVFGRDPTACHRAALHLRDGVRDIPIWLFTTVPPRAETESLCDRVFVHSSELALLLDAERRLWPRWVAICAAEWRGDRGHWPLKLAPFLIPPGKALLQNERGDFVAGAPGPILAHAWRRMHDESAHVSQAIREWFHRRREQISDGLQTASSFMVATGIAIGLGLLHVLGAALGWIGYSPARVFAKAHGRDRFAVDVTASSGEDVVRIRQKGGVWNFREIESTLRASDARWVLWHEAAADPRLDDLLPLFDLDRTFAAAPQQYFGAWKETVLPLAPFRTLQPGEAGQVLAPYSSAILADRRMLLALGIPRVHLAGAAWMILFWKAAAAGWRSYAVGQSKSLREIPDLPMQETSFFLRAMCDRQLLRLGPGEPELSRGAIAFRPAAPQPENGRLKVLLVSPFLPFPLSHGGAVRIFNLCRSLRGRADFFLVTVREKDETVDYVRLGEVFRDVIVVDIDERPARDAHLPAQVLYYRTSALRAAVAEAARKHRPDLLQIEYTHMAAFRDAAPAIPALLVEHDLTFSLYRQLAETKPGPESQAEYQRWLEFERHWLHRYDAVWTVSEEDRASAIHEGSRSPETTFSIANGVDVRRYVPSDEPAVEPEVEPELLYVGSFRHLPNIIGFEKLRQEVMPRVWKSLPSVRLTVVAGPGHKEFWTRYSTTSLSKLDSRIDVEGFISDLRPFYARATAVAVPLEVSAGTNIKVLEAMAAGKALVSTPIGCVGLGLVDGTDALIASDWESFADALVQLIRDNALRRRIAARARETAEQRFSWTAIAERAWESYQAITARRESPDPGYEGESPAAPDGSLAASRPGVSQ